MKVIIAGSRSINISLAVLEQMIADSEFEITELVCGMAKGVDLLGKGWAEMKEIPIKKFHPAWTEYGLAAGSIRNHAMGDYADALIAIWDGFSPGTHDMISYMLRLKKPVKLIKLTKGHSSDWSEQRTHNAPVAGSSPAGPSQNKKIEKQGIIEQGDKNGNE